MNIDLSVQYRNGSAHSGCLVGQHEEKVTSVVRSRMGLGLEESSHMLDRCVSHILSNNKFDRCDDIEELVHSLLHCVDDTEVVLLDESTLSDQEKTVYQMLQLLLRKESSLLPKASLLRSILVKRDPQVFSIASDLIKRIFQSLWEQIQRNPDQEFQKKIEALIGNVIALLPFFDPEKIKGGMIRIPQKVDGQWLFAQFRIRTTPLLSGWMAKFFGESIEIVELDPIEEDCQKGACSIRSFQGTTFPAGKGMWQTLLADSMPFGSVGELLLLLGFKAFEGSMGREGTTEKIDLYGQSLGGTTAMLVSLAFPDRCRQASVYGAPKMYSWTVARFLKKLEKKGLEYQSKVTCFVNEGDLVVRAGNALPPGAEVLYLMGMTKHNEIFAHAKAISGQKRVVMLKMDKEEMEAWSTTALIHLVLAPLAFICIGCVFVVQRLIITVFYTLPKEGADALLEKLGVKSVLERPIFLM